MRMSGMFLTDEQLADLEEASLGQGGYKRPMFLAGVDYRVNHKVGNYTHVSACLAAMRYLEEGWESEETVTQRQRAVETARMERDFPGEALAIRRGTQG